MILLIYIVMLISNQSVGSSWKMDLLQSLFLQLIMFLVVVLV
jgi:hypothetical protein